MKPSDCSVDDSSVEIVELSENSKDLQTLKFSTRLLGAFGTEPVITTKSVVRFRMIKNRSKLVRKVFFCHGLQEVEDSQDSCNLYWIGGTLKPHCIRGLLPYQRINRFPRSFELTRKSNLYNNISNMFSRLQIDEADSFIPEFYVISPQAPTDDRHIKGPLIVKPVGLSRGRGIYLANSKHEIQQSSGSVLVSRYIHNPLLIEGLKFDIRLYVAVTSFKPLVAYLYKEGLVRFATRPYGESNLDHLDGHLTNYSLNKTSPQFRRSENADRDDEGHKWTLMALMKRLRIWNIDTTVLMKRIEDVVVKTLLCCKPSMSASQASIPHEGNCFELFGFDILLDSNLKIWLMEVNLSPSLTSDAPIDYKVKTKMLCDLFSIVGIPELDPAGDKPAASAQLVTKIKKGKKRVVVKRGRKLDLSHVGSQKSPIAKCAVVEQMVRRADHRCGDFSRVFPINDWSVYQPWISDEDFPYDYELHHRLLCKSPCKSPKNFHQFD